MRAPRHAQIDGLMKCTVGMPARRRAHSRPRLKSGASTPTKTEGGAARKVRLKARRSQDFRQMARGFDITAHGQFLAWKTGLKSRRPHLRAANAKVAAVRRQAHRELPDHGPGE